jgi:heterodisulfide reductase subunit B2
MRYAYYPGCSSESTARDLHTSSLAVAKALGIELVEIDGWSCCGSTPAHQTDRVLAASLAAVNLYLAHEMKLDVVVNCAECFSRLKMANHEILGNPKMREKIGAAIGKDYDGSVNIRHFIDVLLADVGIERVQENLIHSLNRLKVACYYGCLLVRPPKVTHFDDSENPMHMDRLIDAIGGESIDWPHKVECCGAGLALTRTDVVVDLTDSIIGMAKAAGADCIAVACPMCQINLDMRQSDIQKKSGRQYDMPIVYITQLIGLCLGISQTELGLEKLMVSPSKVIDSMETVV